MLCWKGREVTRKTWCRGELRSGSLAKTLMPRALVGDWHWPEALRWICNGAFTVRRLCRPFVLSQAMIEGWITSAAEALQAEDVISPRSLSAPGAPSVTT